MSIRLFCPNLICRMVLEVPEQTRGRRVRCSHCGMTFLVPKKAERAKPKPAAPAAPANKS